MSEKSNYTENEIVVINERSDILQKVIDKYCKKIEKAIPEFNLEEKSYIDYDNLPDKYKVQGRLWYASESLLNIKNSISEASEQVRNDFDKIAAKVNPRIFKDDFIYWASITMSDIILFSDGTLRKILYSHFENYKIITK